MKTKQARAPFTHLTDKKRDRLHALWKKHKDQKTVAEILDVHPSTICRELRRVGGRGWKYNCNKAQVDAKMKRENSKRPGMKIDRDPELRHYIISGLKQLQSPDAIAGRMKKERRRVRVGTAAIYTWLYHSPAGQKYQRYLCTKRHKKKTQAHTSKRSLIPHRIGLDKRPKTKGLIHTERDLFVSPKNSRATEVGLLVVTPKTKLFAGHIIPSRSTYDVIPAVARVHSRQRVDTSTTDNGTESIHHELLAVPTYFCNPSAPYEKPSVEGGIGLLRRWFLPKGTNLKYISDELYQSQLHVINSKWRKSLNYESAYEASLKHAILKRVPKLSKRQAIAFR